MFEKIKVNPLKYKAKALPNKELNEFVLPALTAGIQNQGLNNFVPKENATILKNVISISANGANTGVTFYQNKEFTVLQDAYAIKWIFTNDLLTDNHYLYLTSSISKTIYGNYEWTNKAGWERVKSESIQLPIKNGNIDFDFMESFIAEIEAERIAKIEAYLLASGLKDYSLTKEEEKALNNFKNQKWQTFNLEDLFGKSTRGKRLKSTDRILGTLPFITAGETNEGISEFIQNEVTVFPKNTTTIDMFGSAKYRNYKYGADDHITVVNNENLTTNASIFTTTAINKSSNSGIYNYGRNFYPKDADELNIMLPVKDQQPNYELMDIIISAIHKMIIKDIVLYTKHKKGHKTI